MEWGVGQLPQGNGEGLGQGRLTVPTSVLSEGTGHTERLAEGVWPPSLCLCLSLGLPPQRPWCLVGKGTSHLLRAVPSTGCPLVPGGQGGHVKTIFSPSESPTALPAPHPQQ